MGIKTSHVIFILVMIMSLFLFGCKSQNSSDKTTAEGTGTDTSSKALDTEKEDPDVSRFETVGYYAFNDVTDKKCEFWKASGINTIELLDVGWYYRPGEPLEKFKSDMSEWISTAHRHGLKVYVVLMTNLEQWNGETDCGNGNGKMFDPDDSEKMAERLKYIEDNVSVWKEADGFSLFAGDPGGVATLTKQKGNIQYYIDMVKAVRKIVRKQVPDAEFNANIWALSQWESKSASPFTYYFWYSEDENGRKILSMSDLINSDIGVEIPGHDYYRPLALRQYATTGLYPEKMFPTADDTQIAKNNGTQRIWGFAHFLLDELDDGDSAGDSRTTLPSINIRYIKKYIDSMYDAGANGVIGGTADQNNALNIYAFSRFASDGELDAEAVLREYASFLVPENQIDTLTEIFKFIDNDANWHQKMPENYKLPEFETKFGSPKEALEAFNTLTPLAESSFPLLESPESYIEKIGQRIRILLPPPEDDVAENVIRISGFNNGEGATIAQTDPTKENGSGFTAVTAAGFTVVYCDCGQSPIDLTEAKEKNASVRLWIYSEKPQEYAGYFQFSNSYSTISAEETWTFEIGIQLKEGWNEYTTKFSEGYPTGSVPSDWSKIGGWRIVLFGQEGDKYYLDNFDIIIGE